MDSLSWSSSLKRSHETRRRLGEEINETYDMITSESEGISKDNSVWNYYPDFKLSRVILQVWLSYLSPNLPFPGYASLDILSQLILRYPNLRILYRDIPGYPDLPSSPGCRFSRCSTITAYRLLSTGAKGQRRMPLLLLSAQFWSNSHGAEAHGQLRTSVKSR